MTDHYKDASKIKGQEARILTSKGDVNIGEAWDSLDLDLNLMEAVITSGISFNG